MEAKESLKGLKLNDRLVARIEQLYRAHAPACLGYARALCGRQVGEAEDIVHDIFVKLFHRSQPPADEQARGYLLASVRNAAANRRRDAARRKLHLAKIAEQDPMFTPPAEQQAGTDMGELLVRLPDEQREVVFLKIWGERTFAQIGSIAGVPLQTVVSRFRYGLAKLREMMEIECNA